MSDSFPHQDGVSSDVERQLVAIARDVTDEDRVLHEPPADLWDGIRRTILNDRVIAFPTPNGFEAQPVEAEIGVEPDPVVLHAIDPDRQSQRTTRRGMSSRHLVLAAAAVMTALMASAAWLNRAPSIELETVASTAITNADLPVVFDQQGDVSLVAEGDQLFLELALPPLPELADEAAYYELWMIDTNVEGMISLGEIDRSTRIAVPEGVDPSNLPVIDLSVEAHDGNAAHSGQSVLRGVLDL